MQTYRLGEKVVDERRLASRYLQGQGVEIGASNLPLEVDPAVASVKYLDRFTRDELRDVFPELSAKPFVQTDIICDIVEEGLRPIADGSLDFVIASHVLEHVPDPLGLFKECHRVLKVHGIFYLGLPDKEQTFDASRVTTPLAHLVRDFELGTKVVDEEHLVDFVEKVLKTPIPLDPIERQHLFDRELRRSLHIHVWGWRDMLEFIRHMVSSGNAVFALRDLYLPKGVTNEAIFLLEKVPGPIEEAVRRFDSTVATLVAREEAIETAAFSSDWPRGLARVTWAIARYANTFARCGPRAGLERVLQRIWGANS